jgi:hypothetical protein
VLEFSVYAEHIVEITRRFPRPTLPESTLLRNGTATLPQSTLPKIAHFPRIPFIPNDFNSTRINTSGAKDLKSPGINTSGNKDLKSFRINTSKKHRRGAGHAQFSSIFPNRARRRSSAADFFGNYHHRLLSCYHSRAARNRTAHLDRRSVNTEFPRSAKKGDF